MFTGPNIDEYSLYKPTSRKSKTNIVQIDDNYNDNPEEIKKLAERLFKDNEYSVYKINEFVFLQLGNNKQIHAQDISIKVFDDLLKIFLVKLYSANSDIKYNIKYLDNSYVSFGYKMDDFIIERKAL